jgi:hypothetical protein
MRTPASGKEQKDSDATVLVGDGMPDEDTVRGGTLGGLHRRDVPGRVETLLHWYPQQVELRIRPEAPQVEDDHHYVIDWQFLCQADPLTGQTDDSDNPHSH